MTHPKVAAAPSVRPPLDAPAARLAGLLSARRGERHVVAVQDFPDPDAISSAFAYCEMARAVGVGATIMYEGEISHPENRALVNLLHVDLVRYDEQDLAAFDAAVFVDNGGTTTRLTPRLEAAGVPTFAVVDHHEPQGMLTAEFTDVRPVGAAATIFLEYLRSGELLTLDPKEPRHTALAPALMHGLRSETDDFLHAGEVEYEAAAFASRFADQELLQQVLCVQKSRATMDVIAAALAARDFRSGFVVAGVGYLRRADRDAIPQAADFLLQEENVQTAVVYGIVETEEGDEGDEIVSGSLRTRRATLRVDTFLKEALGKADGGRYYGGGRSLAGGFEIDLGFLGGEAEGSVERAAKWELFDAQIRRKLFAAAGVCDPDDA
ncbi:bifunctional oligoribonuclease/PAP phosphatase NrnA [soil metagenome]